MLSVSRLKTVYTFLAAYNKNPRIGIKQLYKDSPYRTITSTKNLLNEALYTQVLIAPRIFLNAHLDVELFKREETDLKEIIDLFDETISNPKVTYSILLAGAHSLLVFKKGATTLSYAEAVTPSYPGRILISEINPRECGRLPSDPYPQGWKDLDWELYNHMKIPTISYREMGRRLNISWQTVKVHFEKIVKDCKTWHSFFPKGLTNYYHAFLTFQTDYEIGMRKELMKLDRTSFIYKFEDTLMLYIVLDSQTEINRFYDLEKKGVIHDLRVSTPIQWYDDL